ncbi:tail assembly protein [Escherichia phage JacobBurckhardt]|uniref:Tail assembly protein n=1 Tax=Escherichia phage JacobBurckhardt TaxID=2852037 RepID=A0AAE7VV49_9CAUD|nr:tail assembly protein [Escherichia phage JacobBurckhardt]
MGKKVKKAVKKVTKSVKKVVKEVARPVKQIAGGLAGGAGEAQVVEVPQAAATPAAQIVDVPEKEVSTEDEAQTESGRKKARAGGKKSLSVARSSGGGINI